MSAPEKNSVRARAGWRVLEGEGEGRTLPHSIEAEEYLLSACMLDGEDVLMKCLDARLTPESFYDQKNGRIFEAMLALHRRREPVAVDTVTEELKTARALDAVGGYAFIAQISKHIPTTAQAAYYIDKVLEQWLLRRAIRRGTELVEECYNYAGGARGHREVLGLLEPHAAAVQRMIDYMRRGEVTLKDAAAAALKRSLNEAAGRVDRSRWLFTGLPQFDDDFGAFDVNNESWLVLICAVTSGGKSAFARQVAHHNLARGFPGMVFLLETSMGKWLEMAAATASCTNARLKHSLPKDMAASFEAALRECHGWIGERLWIDDTVAPVETIVARIEEHQRRHAADPAKQLRWVIVDHLHELKSRDKFKARAEEVGYCARLLKQCAKRLHITLFAPAQLNRGPGKEGRRPEKFDIRDSGEVENAADEILMIHTPKMNRNNDEQTDNMAIVQVELIRAKSRNGPIGHREFSFNRPQTRFYDFHAARRSPPPVTPAAAAPAKGVDFRRLMKSQEGSA